MTLFSEMIEEEDSVRGCWLLLFLVAIIFVVVVGCFYDVLKHMVTHVVPSKSERGCAGVARSIY